MKNKKILVCGAYGLVGSTICKILERDYPLVEIKKLKFMGGLDDNLLLWTEYKSFDYIIHAAGYGQPQMFGKDKIKTIDVNTRFTNTLFEFLRPEGKFLFVSSSEVYSGAPSPHTEKMIGTTSPQHPRACYIEGKRCGEAICMAYKELGFDVKIARLALAYGPGTKSKDTRVLNQFIEQALTSKEILMRDDGAAMRTYIYVEDAAQLMLNILFKGKDVVYNVGGKSRTSVLDLAVRIGKITGAEVRPGMINLEGAPYDVGLDMTKTLNEFPMDLADFDWGLEKTIEYQKQLYATT